MNYFRLFVTLTFFFCYLVTNLFAQSNPQIVGYFPSWKVHERNDLLRPSNDNVDFSKYTMLNYAFFKVDSTGNITGNHAWIDSICIKGELNWTKTQTTLDTRIPTRQLEELMFKGDENWDRIFEPYYKPNTSLIDRAHLWGVPVLVSIGGPEYSGVFPKMAANPENRKRFAEECVRILRQNKFDGIEIHWQFPGYSPNNGTPDDKKNFTLLLKDVRSALDEYSEKIKYPFLLTASLGASENNMENIEWKKVSSILDYINISTYQYSGQWGRTAHHLAPLLSTNDNEYETSYSDVYNRLTKLHNVPKSKVNIGIGYFGRSINFDKGSAALNATNSVDYTKKNTPKDSLIPQYILANDTTAFIERWDTLALAPYLINHDKSVFISFENQRSIQLKTNYIKRTDLAGITIWDISNEYYLKNTGTIGDLGLTELIRDILEPEIKDKIKKRWK